MADANVLQELLQMKPWQSRLDQGEMAEPIMQSSLGYGRDKRIGWELESWGIQPESCGVEPRAGWYSGEQASR